MKMMKVKMEGVEERMGGEEWKKREKKETARSKKQKIDGRKNCIMCWRRMVHIDQTEGKTDGRERASDGDRLTQVERGRIRWGKG